VLGLVSMAVAAVTLYVCVCVCVCVCPACCTDRYNPYERTNLMLYIPTFRSPRAPRPPSILTGLTEDCLRVELLSAQGV
jgi:hypothetical protein